ncbi:MAG TPA: class I SAM-dependent methyltransferase [Gemmatimonadaceae bacterium]|nr:class I SAM-dependent methyltransferase [Gemmatimonadaceae bacterium]
MDNTERFNDRVELYERYRQRYPTDLVLNLLRKWCGLQPDWLVADVGAGTGMLSEVFLANGNPVVAIEPNAGMRAACERLLEQWPKLQVKDATAEKTGLPNGSVEIVAAGRAFHWFDTERALQEFRRVLVPDGWVVLAAIARGKDDSAQGMAFEHLLVECATDYACIRGGYRIHEQLGSLFPRELHQDHIDSEESLSWDEFLGQTMSASIAPTRDDPRFPAFEQAMKEHFAEFANDGMLRMTTTCWVSAGRL